MNPEEKLAAAISEYFAEKAKELPPRISMFEVPVILGLFEIIHKNVIEALDKGFAENRRMLLDIIKLRGN